MIVKCANMLKVKMGGRMKRKCDKCDMPRWIKKQNNSIKDGTGLCSICYLAKESWAKKIDEDFEAELAQDANRENAIEMEKEMEGL